MFLLKQAELTAKKSARGTAGRSIYSQQRRYCICINQLGAPAGVTGTVSVYIRQQ